MADTKVGGLNPREAQRDEIPLSRGPSARHDIEAAVWLHEMKWENRMFGRNNVIKQDGTIEIKMRWIRLDKVRWDKGIQNHIWG